jgi:hypothetical protein
MNFIILFALSIGSAIANGVIYADTSNNSGTHFEFGADAATPFMSAFITFWYVRLLKISFCRWIDKVAGQFANPYDHSILFHV